MQNFYCNDAKIKSLAMKKFVLVSTANKVFSAILLIAITLSILSYVFAATPNPGHNFSAIGGGVVQGDLLFGSSTDTLGALPKNTTATRYLSNTGVNNNPAWAAIDLANGTTGVLPGSSGGTNNAFISFTGPSASLRTFTLPNATATILTDNADVTVAQGGTGLGTLTLNSLLVGAGTGNVTFIAPSGDGSILQSNGTTWAAASSGVLFNRQTLTSGTTYTPTAGTKEILIRMWGGGGAGGGCNAAAGCAGGGGGSGGYAEYYLTNVGGTYTYSIGAGGVGAVGAVGGAGGNTTFNTGATTITAFGGGGGAFTAGSAAIKFMLGGAGGVVSTNGHVNGAGEPGGVGMTSTVNTVVMSGSGASTALGGGGIGRSNVTGAGNAAVANTGSGGSGGAKIVAAGTNAGGNGAAGVIIITEFR
jgi:hypothetical protein